MWIKNRKPYATWEITTKRNTTFIKTKKRTQEIKSDSAGKKSYWKKAFSFTFKVPSLIKSLISEIWAGEGEVT